MKFKLDISEYLFPIEKQKLEKTKDGNNVIPVLDESGHQIYDRVEEKVTPKYEWPHILCNGKIGAKEGKDSLEGFDMWKIGPVAHKIQTCQDEKFVYLDQAEADILKERVQKVSPHISGLRYANWILRILSMEKVTE